MYLKSRYVQIREIEIRTATDPMPNGTLFHGRYFPQLALNDWTMRRRVRMQNIVHLKFMIEHDFESLKEHETEKV